MDYKKIIILFFISITSAIAQKNIELKIDGFKELKGNLAVQVKDQNQKVIFQKLIPVAKNTETLIISNLSASIITVECFHDINSNKKLDTNFLGIPTEPWGVSNDVRPSFRGPSHHEMLIDISKLKEIAIHVK